MPEAALTVLPVPVSVTAAPAGKATVSLDAVMTSPVARLIAAPVPLTVSVALAAKVTVSVETTAMVAPLPLDGVGGAGGQRDRVA